MRFISLRDDSDSTDPALVDYSAAWDLQLALVDAVASGRAPNTVLFVEHPPVITRGRGLQFTGESRDRHAPPPFGPGAEGVPVIEINRGGDLTYHGPGQLVVYPILRLDGEEAPARDVEKYLRGFETATIAVLADYDLEGFTRKNEAGVWVHASEDGAISVASGSARKIASIGIGVRKWTTFHGLALNVVNSLAPFFAFSPCGFDSEVMTSLDRSSPDFRRRESEGIDGGDETSSGWRTRLESAFARELVRAFRGDALDSAREAAGAGDPKVEHWDHRELDRSLRT